MIVRPFVVLAARFPGPGTRRFDLVKLAHGLGDGDDYFEVFYARRRPEPRTASKAPAA
jgi:hypothetical protein